MFALKRLVPAAGLSCVLMLGACGDSLGPGDVDPLSLQNDMSKSTGAFVNNIAFQSVSILSAKFPQYAAVQLASGTLSRVGGLARMSRSPAPGLGELRLAAITSDILALFPSNVLGKTLEWDTQTSTYIIGTATGAPANGVRLVLYSANPTTGNPVLPLQALGSLDLTDESTPQADRLGVLLRLGPSTVIAQYDITRIASTSAVTVNAVGYMRNATGTLTVDFDIQDDVDLQNSTFVTNNDLSADDGTSIHVDLSVGPSVDDLNATVSRGGATLELNATGDILGSQGPLAGQIKFNGVAVANLTGTVNAPTVTGTNGHSFSSQQSTAMLIIFGTAIEVAFDLAGGILAPGEIVFN